MPLCPIHKVDYDQSHAVCMRKYMGIPDPGGPATGDGMIPQDIMDEFKKRGLGLRLSPRSTDADGTDADDKKVGP